MSIPSSFLRVGRRAVHNTTWPALEAPARKKRSRVLVDQVADHVRLIGERRRRSGLGNRGACRRGEAGDEQSGSENLAHGRLSRSVARRYVAPNGS